MSFQLIFRKVSDVLKEQELAERRKNDPVLNHTQDHLVRKLFSKFKKGDGTPSGSLVGPGLPTSTSSIVPSNRLEKDLEKGEINLATVAKTALVSKKDIIPEVAVTDVTNVPTTSTPASKPVVSKPAPKLSGWARFKGGGGGGASTEKPDSPAPAAPTSSTAPSTTEKVDDKKLTPPSGEQQPDTKSEKNTKPTTPKKDPSLPSSTAPAQSINSVEYQAINDRLNRIENLISDFMVKLDDKTRSIEKSVAKVRSSKSKHAKPHVTICVDSAGNQGPDSNCDEQYL